MFADLPPSTIACLEILFRKIENFKLEIHWIQSKTSEIDFDFVNLIQLNGIRCETLKDASKNLLNYWDDLLKLVFFATHC